MPLRPAEDGSDKWNLLRSNLELVARASELADEYKINFAIHNHGTNLLHGSSCLLADAVKVLQSPEVGLSEAECLKVAHENPLRLIGLDGWTA